MEKAGSDLVVSKGQTRLFEMESLMSKAEPSSGAKEREYLKVSP